PFSAGELPRVPVDRRVGIDRIQMQMMEAWGREHDDLPGHGVAICLARQYTRRGKARGEATMAYEHTPADTEVCVGHAGGRGAYTTPRVSRSCAMHNATSSHQGAAMICTPIGNASPSTTGTVTTGRPMKEIGWV